MAKAARQNLELKTFKLELICKDKLKKPKPGWEDCMVLEACAKVKALNEEKENTTRLRPSPSDPENDDHDLYNAGKDRFAANFEQTVDRCGAESDEVKNMFLHPCRHKKWLEQGAKRPVPRSRKTERAKNKRYNPDHRIDAGLNGSLKTDNLRWANSRMNTTVGAFLQKYDPAEYPGGIVMDESCECDS